MVEGTVELSPVATFHDDETVEELIRVYRDAAGEHPDWADYRRAMVDDHRLVARLVVDHAYGRSVPDRLPAGDGRRGVGGPT